MPGFSRPRALIASSAGWLAYLAIAFPATGQTAATGNVALGYDTFWGASMSGGGATESALPAALVKGLQPKERAHYLQAHWQELSGPALGEFAFWYMTSRTVDTDYAGPALPLAVFRALPILFPNRFPDPTFANYGLLPDPNDPDGLPVGLKTGGTEPKYVDFTCAACHAGAVDGRPVAGVPNQAVRYGDLQLQLAAALGDYRLTLDRIVEAAQTSTGKDLSIPEKAEISAWLRFRRLPPRYPTSVRALIADWGPGRMDILSGTGFPAAIPSLFGRQHTYLCDGIFTAGTEVAKLSLVGRGVPYGKLDSKQARRLFAAVDAYVAGLAPPANPNPDDHGLVLRGKRVYDQNCAACHTAKVGTLLPLEAVGTDPQRIRQESLFDEIALQWLGFKGVQLQLWPMVKIPSLAGVSFRQTLLHNGSVPTLEDLLEPADRRPPVFANAGTVFDTSLPGNRNSGHEFATDLPDSDKAALVAYLRTL
ncbi:MAG: c-type cytochrome [Cyanobacteria bacterium REEB65]|nr:c-type cytochrome [Cyanobacteria bacterium REEB65]